MSKTGCNYRNLLDCDGKLSIVTKLRTWKETCNELFHSISTLHELIDIREGRKYCIGFSVAQINAFILDICIH